MLKEAERQAITISPEAAQAVQGIINDKKMDGHALRIYVSGSSCSGVQFGMALDDKINDTDTTIEAEGVKIIVDHQSLDYAQGASIEFVNDPEKGTGFVISNPNANTGGCNCGSSSAASGGSSCGSSDSAGCGSGSCGCGH